MCVVFGIIQTALFLNPPSAKEISSPFENITTLAGPTENMSQEIVTTAATDEIVDRTEPPTMPTPPPPALPPPTQENVPETSKGNYQDVNSRRKSSISLLERIKNPNTKTTNYLQKTNNVGADEVTHFRERIQTGEHDFRYKTSRNKTESRGKRELERGEGEPGLWKSYPTIRRRFFIESSAVNEVGDRYMDRRKRSAVGSSNKTEGGAAESAALTGHFHIAIGLTLFSCVVIYSGNRYDSLSLVSVTF